MNPTTDRIWISASGDSPENRSLGAALASEIVRMGGSVVFGTDSRELLGIDAGDVLAAWTDDPAGRWTCYLPPVKHRDLGEEALAALKERPETFVLLDESGNPIPSEHWGGDRPVNTDIGDAESLTNARKAIRDKCDGLAIIGGRVDGYQGKMPGVIEEFLLMSSAPDSLKRIVICPDTGGAAQVIGQIARGLDLDEIYGDEYRDQIPPGMAEILHLKQQDCFKMVSALLDLEVRTAFDVAERFEFLSSKEYLEPLFGNGGGEDGDGEDGDGEDGDDGK